MKGPEFLSRHVGKIESAVGGFVPGSHATMRGLDLHASFKDANWADLFLFSITGRRLTQAQVELVQSIWIYTSYPDARLWNNRVAGLAGTARSTGSLALAAALAVSEATIYGGGTYMPAIDFLQRTYRNIQAGRSLQECIDEEFETRRGISGFGRPLTSRDERLIPLMNRALQLGLGSGPHVQLVKQIEEHLTNRRLRLRINFAALAAALLADQGFTPTEMYLSGFPTFLAGMVPVFMEANSKTEGALFPIPCEDISYSGPSPRSWNGRMLEKSKHLTGNEVNGTAAAPGVES